MLNHLVFQFATRALPISILTMLVSGCEKPPEKKPERVVAVTSTQVQQLTIPERVPAVGSLRAIEISTLAPEVAGNVIGRYFEDGQRIKRGDILYTLDRRTQEAQLQSTKAQLAEQEWIWERMKILAETQSASDAEVAETAYAIESLKAQVAQQESVVDKLTIRAPYDGRVAIHMIDVGSYAAIGDNLVEVVNDSMMLVDYDLPTMWLPKLKVGQEISLITEADPTRTYSGRVTAINPMVNVSTRTIQVRGQIPNSDFSLRSGLYAHVSHVVGSFDDVLVVPQGSLIYSDAGASVYAVEQSRAVLVPVEVIHKFDAEAIVAPGKRPKKSSSTPSNANASKPPAVTLKKGLQIVVEGAAKIRPGMKLKTSPFHPADVSVTTGLAKTKTTGED
ncbi:MAG: hypothetical protein CMJ39_01250 [Phycisphaerae bacterium]|nr:hypothetical protein [Phycisphaerae bacterium]|tara:strand:- start:665 stop:1837 length:1173 start_codon:yes stop_codon:yes gene_type:complete